MTDRADDDSGLEQDNAVETPADTEMSLSAAIDAALDASTEEDQPAPDESAPSTETDEAAANNAAPEDQKQDAEEPEQAKPELKAPEHWPAERRQAIDALPEESRRAVLDQVKDIEAGITRKSQELSEAARYTKEVRELFTPEERQVLAQSGQSDTALISNLLQHFRAIQADPVSYYSRQIREHNLTPEQLFGEQQAGPDTYVDPQIQQLQNQIAGLQSNITASQQAAQQAARQQQISQVEQTITNWAGEMDANGQPLRPHFDQLRGDIAMLMQSHPEISVMADGTDKLAKAYETAAWMNPTVKTQLIADETAKAAEAARQAEEANRVRRGASPRATAGNTVTAPVVDSLDDALEVSMKSMGF